MFFSSVRGGASLEKPYEREFQLHNATLKYLEPRGFQGFSGSRLKIINYRSKLHKFEGIDCSYQLEAAVWVYYRSHMLDRFFRQDIGQLTYDVKLYKLPKSICDASSKERMNEYAKYFLHTLLEGEDGYNTQTRNSFPNESDEHLIDMLIDTPKIERVILGKTKWFNFKIYTPPVNVSHTDYYFTLLNNEFALGFEWSPISNYHRKRERKEVEATNQKAIELMKNSIRLEFQ